MNIVGIRLKNYGPYREEHYFHLTSRGLTLVLGENLDEPMMSNNGSGKSTIFDALDWCCFGKVPRGDHVDSIINEAVGKDCVVTTYLEDEGVAAGITRGRAPKILQFVVAGEDRTALDDVETQRRIELWLGLDREVFHAAVLHGQLDLMRFAEATDKERIGILTKVLELEDIDRYQEMAKAARDRVIAEGQDKRTEFMRLEGQLEVLKGKSFEAQATEWEANRSRDVQQRTLVINQFNDSIAWWYKRLPGLLPGKIRKGMVYATWENQLRKLEGEIEALRGQSFEKEAREWSDHRAQRLRDATETLNRHLSEIAEWQPIADQEQQILEDEQAILATQVTLDVSSWEIRLQALRMDRDRYHMDRGRATMEGERLKARRDKVAAAKGDCSECGRPYDPEHIAKELEKIEASLIVLRGAWTEADTQFRKVEDEIRTTIDELNEQTSLHQESCNENQRVLGELKALKTKSQEAKDFVARATKHVEGVLRPAMEKTRTEENPYVLKQQQLAVQIEALEANLRTEAADYVMTVYDYVNEDLTVALQRAVEAANPFHAEQKALDDQRAGIEAQLEVLRKEVADNADALLYYEFWVEGFGQKGLKSYILDTKLTELTDAANQWVHMLTGGTIWVRFETQTLGRSTKKLSNKINIRVFRYNRDGSISERNYRSWSGGEKQRVSLGVDFGLSRLIASRARKPYNLLILDELFKHLDRAGQEAVVEMLQVLSREKDSVFVVDHGDVFQESFDNVVVARKEYGASHICEVSNVQHQEEQTQSPQV